MTENECQHCHREVKFGMTEQGFRGFVHVDSDLAACENRDALGRELVDD